jgi:hypothetical protein
MEICNTVPELSQTTEVNIVAPTVQLNVASTGIFNAFTHTAVEEKQPFGNAH